MKEIIIVFNLPKIRFQAQTIIIRNKSSTQFKQITSRRSRLTL